MSFHADTACPECRKPLRQLSEAEFEIWACGEGHGVGCTFEEARTHLQNDDLNVIMELARDASHDRHMKSPTLGTPMVAVDAPVDHDEVFGNEGAGQVVRVYVDRNEGFLWLPVESFTKMMGSGQRTLRFLVEAARSLNA